MGVFWTLVALTVTGYHAVNLFPKHGVAHENIENHRVLCWERETMNKLQIYTSIIICCIAFCFGCRKSQPTPRFHGIVRSHVDTYQSGTGTSADLVRGNQSGSGFDYGDTGKTDWKSQIRWELVAQKGPSDVYEFNWTFSPSGGTTVSESRRVEYDGKKSVIVFQNEYEVIAIEPGSIPLQKNSQPAGGLNAPSADAPGA